MSGANTWASPPRAAASPLTSSPRGGLNCRPPPSTSSAACTTRSFSQVRAGAVAVTWTCGLGRGLAGLPRSSNSLPPLPSATHAADGGMWAVGFRDVGAAADGADSAGGAGAGASRLNPHPQRLLAPEQVATACGLDPARFAARLEPATGLSAVGLTLQRGLRHSFMLTGARGAGTPAEPLPGSAAPPTPPPRRGRSCVARLVDGAATP